jgi:hypothetical protein
VKLGIWNLKLRSNFNLMENSEKSRILKGIREERKISIFEIGGILVNEQELGPIYAAQYEQERRGQKRT